MAHTQNPAGGAYQQHGVLRVAAGFFVVFDDLDLRLGQIRIRPRGGNGGHNGVGDLIEVLGTDRFSRLRLGIGQSPSGGVIDHVLEPFGQDELPTVEAMVEDATNAALCWLREGVQSAMNRYNAALANSHEASAGGSKADRDAQSGVSQEFSERTKLKVVAPAVAEGAGPVSQTAVKERLYEGMFLLDSNQAAKDWSDLEAHVRGILERHSARIEHAERWPDQRLATEIKGVKKGTYYLTYFYAPTEAIAAIRRDVELTDRILRCMVVQEDFLEEEMKRRQEQARRRAAQPTPHAAPREDPAPPAEEADSFVAEPAAKGNDLLEEEVTAAAEGSVEESFAEEGDHSEGADSSDEKPSQE